MSNSEAAEYRLRTDEAIRRLSGETDPAAWDHWRKLAIEYSRLSDLAAMREGLQRKRAEGKGAADKDGRVSIAGPAQINQQDSHPDTNQTGHSA